MDRTARLPIAPMGLIALFVAFVAVALAIYGVTPYPRILNFPQQPLPDESKTLYALTIYVPIGLGLLALVLSAWTTRIIIQSQGTKAGEGPAVFAKWIGMLALTLSGVTAFVVFGKVTM